MKKYYLYALFDPNLKIPKYIGISNNPERRFKEHIEDVSDTKKTRWIKSLKEGGQLPILKVVRETENVNIVIAWEKKAIEKFQDKYSLTNSTKGGEYYAIGTPIKVFDISGNFLETYNSMIEYAELIGLNPNSYSSISAVCLRKRNYAYNRIFRYINDTVTEEDLKKLEESFHKRDPVHFFIYDLKGNILGEFNCLEEAERQGFGQAGAISRVLREIPGHSSIKNNLVCYDENDYLSKLTKYMKEKTHNKLKSPISMYDLDGNYLDTFYTIADAARAASGKDGKIRNTIRHCCDTQSSKSLEKQWRYGISKENIGPYKKTYNSSNRNKVIDQFDLDNNFIKRWNSAKEAAESLSINVSGIRSCANGSQNSSAGYIWKYVSAV